MILNATVAYYSHIQAQAVRDVAQEGLRQAEAHLAQAKIMLEAGRGVRFNVVKAEVDLANAKLALVKSRNVIVTSRLQLENVMGAKISPADIVTENVEDIPEEMPVDSAYAIALRNRPEARAADLRMLAAQYSVSVASRSRWPVLSAFGSYGYRASKLDTAGTDNWTTGLNVTMPLFLGGALRGSAEQAQGNLKQALALQVFVRQQISLEVEQQIVAQKEATERIAIAAKAVEQAELALTLAKERFSLGSGNPLEVTDSELSMENAKIAHIQALCDYRIAQVRLKRAMGILGRE
jgi:outer membrane protein TolC